MLIAFPLFSNAQTVTFDFEEASLEGWTQSPEFQWVASPTNPLGGTYSLRHSSPASVGLADRISVPLPGWDYNNGKTIWRFRIRHNTEPTSGNHWGIFLSCNLNATGMISTSQPNGYVVGVNLEPSTDDLLKLYKVANGVFTPIITTTLNWQTQVGYNLSAIGAVEVERKPDGIFTLKVSTSGSFLNLSPMGSVSNTDFDIGGFFGVYFKYTAANAGKLTIDDISFTYKPVNPNDHDALVINPSQQIEAGSISSLANNSLLAVDVFRFTIHDQGTSDGLPTYTTKLRFAKALSENSINWLQTIGGIRLRSASAEIPIIATYIFSNAVELEVNKNSMVVNNNTSREFTLSLYLKNENIQNGATLKLQVDNIDHGWETDFTGSEFAPTFPSSVVSSLFTIQVIPTHLTFTEYPQQVVVNQPFNVKAHATDALGNLATTFESSQVTLGLAQGSASLTPPSALVTNIVGGVANWYNIAYTGRDVFKLVASTDGLKNATSGDIIVINDPTSIVVNPDVQPVSAPISSTITTPGTAAEVFRFNIVDNADNDGVPTYVRQITIKRAAGENLASFSSSIAGVLLKANGQIVPIGNPNILTASISIPISSGVLMIPDGQEVEVSLFVYLRTTGIADGTILRFMVDSDNHGFIADAGGSSFANTFPRQVISDLFPLAVQAKKLTFSTIPQYVGLGDTFSVEVSAVDEAGNLDVHATGIVTLSKNSGDGWLTIPSANASLTGGKVSWNGLVYYMAQPFTLLASTQLLNDVVSTLIYCSDRTSTLLPPSVQLSNGTFSTLSVEPENATEVFRFRVSDPGTTDGLPTHITQLVFRSFGLPTDVSFTKAVGGAMLFSGDIQIPTSSVTIISNTITLTFETGSLVVPNSSAIDLSLRLYLKKGGQIDGSTICLHVPAASHGCQASVVGSGIVTTLEQSIVGAVFSIDAVATTISFVDQPFIVVPPNPLSLSVAATDIYRNVDKNTSGIVNLQLNYGPSTFLTNSNNLPLINGVAVWNDIILGSTGKYQFRASATLGETIGTLSQPIWSGGSQPCIINENFNSDPISFALSSDWSVSTVSPIDGTRSLKHALSGVAGESRLSIPQNISNLGSGPLEWSFVIRNGNWDPSADNSFWFVLASDSISIKVGDFNGYAVGVNLSGTSDLLTLWRLSKGKTPQVLIESDFNWDENETVWIKVTRTPGGEWSLWFQPRFGESTIRLAGQIIDIQNIVSLSSGPNYKFSASRAGELWLDNIRTCGVAYPPIISSARVLNLTSVDVTFSAPVNLDDAALTSKYAIKTLAGSPVTIHEAFTIQDNPLKVTLRTSTLPFEDLKLTIKGIRNSSGTLTMRDSIVFGMGTPGTFGSIVINEIMARPSPPVGLPSVEYIELFNRTSSPISLNGWRIRGNTSYVNIPNASIEPNGYLLLSGTSGASAMSQFGNAIGVTSFPTLLVGGMFLAIYDNNNKVISWVEYSDTWYGDAIKKAGGYSLERIDPDNLVVGKKNWIASNDPSGGTPGRENSVLTSNPDIVQPRVVELKIVTPTIIEVGFSEPMDSLSIALIHNYSISSAIGNPIWATTWGPKYNRVSLTLSTSLVTNQIYNIYFEETIVDFSGNSLLINSMQFAVPQEPVTNEIAINEVLFNPYTGGVDFVEIFNRSNKTFDINKLWIANRNKTSPYSINEYYAASDTSKLLFPSCYAVLSINPSLVQQYYYIENPDALIWTSKMPSYPNDSGYVLILNEFGEILDEFYYTEKMHFSLLSDVKGVSLERIHPDLPASDPSSWQSAAQTSGFATPTARNSQYQEPSESTDAFTLNPQSFSPDGDGFDDLLMIEYELPEAGYIANIMVFDSKGRRVKRLAANTTLGTSGSIKWDGSTDEGKRANIGAYVVFIEAFDLRGNVKRYRKTCVVATKFAN